MWPPCHVQWCNKLLYWCFLCICVFPLPAFYCHVWILHISSGIVILLWTDLWFSGTCYRMLLSWCDDKTLVILGRSLPPLVAFSPLCQTGNRGGKWASYFWGTEGARVPGVVSLLPSAAVAAACSLVWTQHRLHRPGQIWKQNIMCLTRSRLQNHCLQFLWH